MKQFSAAQLAVRRPVWMSISELFLDTSLDARDIDRIAGCLAASPFDLQELDDILLWEVYPACLTNLFSMAGEWAAFDPAWLERRILRGPSWFMYACAGTLGRISLHSSLQWRKIKRRVIEHRKR